MPQHIILVQILPNSKWRGVFTDHLRVLAFSETLCWDVKIILKAEEDTRIENPLESEQSRWPTLFPLHWGRGGRGRGGLGGGGGRGGNWAMRFWTVQ